MVSRRIAAIAISTLVAAAPCGAGDDVGLQAFEPLLQSLFESSSSDQRLWLLGVGLDAPQIADPVSDRAAIRILLDGLPPGGSLSIVDVYSDALQSAEAAPYVLTNDEAAQLAQVELVLMKERTFWDWLLARRRLATASKKMLAYEAHATQVAAAEQAFKDNPSTATKEGLESSRRAWEVYGYKAEVDAALLQYRTITGGDPALWLRDLRATAADAEAAVAATPELAIQAFTDVSSWRGDEGWIAVASTDGVRRIDCQVKRVVLRREWLDASFFQSRRWRWLPGGAFSADSLLSAGGTETPDARTREHLPFIPQGLLLARSCTAISGGVNVRIETPQVVGYFATRNPRSPNPDEALWRVPRPVAPRAEIPFGVLHGFSFGDGGYNNKHGQVGPVPYFHHSLAGPCDVVVAPGFAAQLRGVGIVLGLGARVFKGGPLRAIAGVRVGTSVQRFRFFVGAGIDFSLPGSSSSHAAQQTQ